jgi:hypothetical protein
VISDGRARKLASYWADPREPTAPMANLARSGTVTDQTIEVLRHDLQVLQGAAEGTESEAQAQLRALLDYVTSCGERGPVLGWEDLDDDVPPEPAEEPQPAPTEDETSALDLPFPER